MYDYPPQIYQILEKGNFTEVRQVFAITDSNVELLPQKFDLWAKTFFPTTFKIEDAPFHYDMNQNLADLYLGTIESLAQIHFRGATKTTRTKIFIAFVLANDQRISRRRYLKIVSEDPINSKQMTTDIYNMLISSKVKQYYPHLFAKSDKKRAETMAEFDLTTGVKVLASTVSRNQRGHLAGEDNARPDWIVFEDFETSITVQSLADTRSIWSNMEEAWNGKALGGVGLYNCNYISKRRNVQKIIDRANRSPERHRLHIVPIDDRKKATDPVGKPLWSNAYTRERIAQMELDVEDFAGEYLCMPSGTTDSFFSEEHLAKHPSVEPILTTKDGWVYFFKKDPTHQYILGVDPAGGTGGNFATIVVIDWTLRMVVAYFRDRYTQPDKLGEISLEKAKLFNNALIVPETNYQGLVLLKVYNDAGYSNVYVNKIASEKVDKKHDAYKEDTSDILGFVTTSQSKPLILSALSTAIKNFHLIVPIKAIKKELIEFPREYVELVKADDDDLGHFDLTIALALAWEGRNQVIGKSFTKKYN